MRNQNYNVHLYRKQPITGIMKVLSLQISDKLDKAVSDKLNTPLTVFIVAGFAVGSFLAVHGW